VNKQSHERLLEATKIVSAALTVSANIFLLKTTRATSPHLPVPDPSTVRSAEAVLLRDPTPLAVWMLGQVLAFPALFLAHIHTGPDKKWGERIPQRVPDPAPDAGEGVDGTAGFHKILGMNV
jgi:hypothetical protein